MNSRPSSARPQTRINPITGEEMPYSSWKGNASQTLTPRETPRLPSRDTPRKGNEEPKGQFRTARGSEMSHNIVPPLNLSRLIGQDEDDEKPGNLKYLLLSPSSVSSISCGSMAPVPAYKPNAQHILMINKDHPRMDNRVSQRVPKVKQPTAWDRVPVPEGLLPPSQRQKDQYQKMAEEQKSAFQQKSAPITAADVDWKIEQLKLMIPPEDDDPVLEEDEDRDMIQRGWTQAPYSKEAMRKIQDKEELEEEKRKSKMLETVLIDQLCRPVISDPLQNQTQSSRASAGHHPRMKPGSVRSVHDSRQMTLYMWNNINRIKTDGTPTENLLSKRVRFDARVLTTNGRDAIRELSGFFFAVDNTLTVYEYRTLGRKSSKALPFIKRGSYSNPRGLQSSHLYSLADIRQGYDLCFDCSGQPLPDSLKCLHFMTLRLTDVDNEAKKDMMLSGLIGVEREEAWKAFHLPRTKEEAVTQLLMEDVQRSVRRQIAKRGLRVFMSLGKLYRNASQHDEGKVNKYELEKGLIDLRIEIPQEKADDLWDILDVENSSFLPYAEFMRAFLGEMNETRKAHVIKAFSKIDSGKRGVVSLGEMSKFYNAHKHPKVKSGECEEEQILEMFLTSFNDTQVKGEVSFREFEEYYEGLSVGIQSDSDFENILKNAWNV